MKTLVFTFVWMMAVALSGISVSAQEPPAKPPADKKSQPPEKPRNFNNKNGGDIQPFNMKVGPDGALPRTLPLMTAFGSAKSALLQEVDVDGKSIKVEVLPSNANLSLSDKTIFLRDGEIIKKKDLADEADIFAVYSSSVEQMATVIIQIAPDQKLAAVQAEVRHVGETSLDLRDSVLETVGTEKTVVIFGTEPGKLEDLKASDAVVVIMSGNHADPQALVVIKPEDGDTSVKTVRARLAPGQTSGPMEFPFMMITAGKPQEMILKIDDRTKLYPSFPAAFGQNGKQTILTLEDLAQKLQKKPGLHVQVQYSRTRDDKEEYFVDSLIVSGGGDGMKTFGPMPPPMKK